MHTALTAVDVQKNVKGTLVYKVGRPYDMPLARIWIRIFHDGEPDRRNLHAVTSRP